VRYGLNSDLAFSDADRRENIRRIGEVAKLFIDAGVIVLTAFISPFRSDRERVRQLVNTGDFLEIYCHCPLEICEERDTKGLYHKARLGQISNFTGISSPYEPPIHPELIVNTETDPLEACADQVLKLLLERGIISQSEIDFLTEAPISSQIG
jgi:adenylylsulfate kinase